MMLDLGGQLWWDGDGSAAGFRLRLGHVHPARLLRSLDLFPYRDGAV
jgi:hypothetical protein